jgi:hypothetical protein
MSAQGEQLTDFERQSRLVLEESVRRIDGRVRSRLNQARHAAVDATAAGRGSWLWRPFAWVPTAGAVAAALLVAAVLWHRDGRVESVLPPATQDLDLIADGDALELIQDGDGSGSFYEWAADQSEPGGANETDS